jgi:sulfur-carrier protein
MTVKVRFFARFHELFGTDIVTDAAEGTGFIDIIKKIAEKNREGYDALFDANGAFRDFVLLMKNGKRIDGKDAAKTVIEDGDEIAVLPPLGGG